MADSYPFTWTGNSKEDQERRAKVWTSCNTLGVESVISHPMELNLYKGFVEDNIHKRIWNMQPRPDDIWVITYPKSGTTMAQELIWQMSRGCNVNSEESKKKLFERTPFLEMAGLFKRCGCEVHSKAPMPPPYLLDPIAHTEGLEGPRIIKSHLPVSMLPPKLLEISKVVVLARNVKDVCVSFYHHERLFKHHGYTGSFDDYARFFMEGKPSAYGDYYVHIKDSLKWSKSKNLLFLWYEDFRTNWEDQVQELVDFTGFDIPEDKMKVLKDHMSIDNFRKNDAVNLSEIPLNDGQDGKTFIRKGKTGDWKELFSSKEKLDEFNAWIEKNNKDSNGKPISGIKY